MFLNALSLRLKPIPDWPVDYDPKRQVIATYSQETLSRFKQVSDAGFTPDLSTLDALVRSIKIAAPAGPSVQKQPVFEWEGYGLCGDDDATKRKAMQIDAEHRIEMGYCDEPLTATELNRPEFGEKVKRLGPFE